jgi:hypothetical protein
MLSPASGAPGGRRISIEDEKLRGLGADVERIS